MTRKKGKKSRNVQKNRQVQVGEPEELKRAPHSFVFHRGNVGNYVHQLIKDFRKVMKPFTASSLKARKKNTIKDYISVAGLLNVSHMCIFTQTELGVYMRIVVLPRGPTLIFKIHSYILARDVLSQSKKQMVSSKQFSNSPLIVLNSFSGDGMHMKLMASTFQNMFPSINIMKVKLNTIRRCVLLNYNTSTKLIDFRHYCIRVVPVGLSRGVKKIVRSKVPKLGKFQDISEFITKSDMLSESEAEDDPEAEVTLPQELSSRGNLVAQKSGIRVYDIGPRMTLQLIKVEDGVMSGEVLFHEYIEKTEEEKELAKKTREEKRKLKEKRKKIQEENKKKKEKLKEELKEKSLLGMKKKQQKQIETADTDYEDNDAEWYRQEVGEEPDKDLFNTPIKTGQKRKFSDTIKQKKKLKANSDSKSHKFKNLQHKANGFKPGFNKNKHSGKVLGSKISRKH